MAEAKYVYYHDCRALGPNTRIPRAMMADRNKEYILYYHHKCPFCSQTAGEKVLGPGVTENEDGSYSVDTAIAERLT